VVPLPDATLRIAAGWRAEALPQGGWRLDRIAADSPPPEASP
jgi:hypothetical protein